MDSSIEVAIPCGPNAAGYVRALVGSLLGLAARPERIHVVYYADGTKKRHLWTGKNAAYRVAKASGSSFSGRHSSIINQIVAESRADYTMVMDADTFMVMKDWDCRLADMLDGSVVIVGSAYETSLKKYQKFPNVVGCMFRTQTIRSLGINFEHADLARSVVDSQRDAEIFGLPVGSEFHKDTGWQLPLKVRAAGYDGIGFRQAREVVTTGGEEFWFGNEVVFAHRAKSVSRGLDKAWIRLWREYVWRTHGVWVLELGRWRRFLW